MLIVALLVGKRQKMMGSNLKKVDYCLRKRVDEGVHPWKLLGVESGAAGEAGLGGGADDVPPWRRACGLSRVASIDEDLWSASGGEGFVAAMEAGLKRVASVGENLSCASGGEDFWCASVGEDFNVAAAMMAGLEEAAGSPTGASQAEEGGAATMAGLVGTAASLMEASLVGLGDAAMSLKGVSTGKEVAAAMTGFGDAAMSPKEASKGRGGCRRNGGLWRCGRPMMRWLRRRWLHGEEQVMGGGQVRSSDRFTCGHDGMMGCESWLINHVCQRALV
jgi:hypothetical protein